MSSLAVVATFFHRPWAVPRIARNLGWGREPDELWLMYEDPADAVALLRDWGVRVLPVQIRPEPGQNPLGLAINTALDMTRCDYIAYLTDDSLPRRDKYDTMVGYLDKNPDCGAVYCSQDYGTAKDADDWLAGGSHSGIRHADRVEADPFCRVDHTQVMHRRTTARWPMSWDDRRLSDAHFFRDLVADLGPLHPVPEVLDWTRQLPDGLSQR